MTAAQVAEMASIALAGASRLQSQIEDVTQYLSHAASVGREVNFRLGQLPGLVADLGEQLGIPSLTVGVPEGLAELRLPMSAKAIDLVVRELLENAQKFHPSHAPAVAWAVSPDGPGAFRIQVSDDGIHLPAEQLDRILAPYYQGERFVIGQVAGMGLGLAMVASLVWEANGHIQVRNRADRPGLVVEITLPQA